MEYDEESGGVAEIVERVSVGVGYGDNGQINLAIAINDHYFVLEEQAVAGLAQGIAEMWPEVLRRRKEAETNG